MAKDTAYKNMSTEELTQELAKLRRELQETRFAHAVSPIAGPHVIKEMRRDISRFMTELHARTQAAQEAATRRKAAEALALEELPQDVLNAAASVTLTLQQSLATTRTNHIPLLPEISKKPTSR